MRIILGLGNPGSEYEHSRHNAGFRVIAALAHEFGIKLEAGRGDFLKGEGAIAGADILLALPLTYVNESGRAVAQLLEDTELFPQDMLVICDDTNLDVGQLRLRRSGGDGGHNGLASIISRIGTEAFPRLRIGVGGPPEGADLADFVLAKASGDALRDMSDAERRAVLAVEAAIRDGIEAAMNAYNARADAADCTDY